MTLQQMSFALSGVVLKKRQNLLRIYAYGSLRPRDEGKNLSVSAVAPD
jgi:hypothetical protein